MLSARAGLRRDPLRSTRSVVQAGRAGQDSPLPQEGDDGDAAMNAIEGEEKNGGISAPGGILVARRAGGQIPLRSYIVSLPCQVAIT